MRASRFVALVAVVVGVLAPVASAHAKDTGLIFVSNEKTNNLIVLDPKTYKVVKDIKTSRRPRDMHFSADRSKLYVACGDDDVIDIIDVAKLEVIGKLATGPSPETFAIDEKRRRIYVANEEGSTLSVIDMDQNIIVHEVPTGAEPEGVFLERGRQDPLCDLGGRRPRAYGRRRGRPRDAGRGGRHAAAPVRGDARPQGAVGHRRTVGRGLHHRPREVRGLRQDRVPAARHAQDRRHAGRPGHDQGRQDRLS